MATNYFKRVNKLDVLQSKDSNTNVVYNVGWSYCLFDTDTDIQVKNVYDTQINTDSISSFKAYADLTESDIVSWIDSTITSSKNTEIRTDLLKQLNDKKCKIVYDMSLPF